MNRFFVEKFNIGNDSIIIDNKDDIHHIRDVIRLKENDYIIISDSSQFEYTCQIIYIGSEEIEARIMDKQKFAREPKIRVTLFQGIPKQDKMETIAQKCTELGLATLVPVFMDRTVVVDNGEYWKKVVRLQSIAEEASKQCQRGIVPEIRQACDSKSMVERLHNFDLVIFPYEEEQYFTIKNLLRGIPVNPIDIAVIIGPEGGFSDREAAAVKAAGGRAVSLGKTILRTETAGIAAMAMIMYELEM